MTEQANTVRTYDIPAANLEAMQRQIARIQKRAARVGAAPVTVTEIGREMRPVMDRGLETAARAEWVTVELRGEAPKFKGGWALVAAIHPLSEGNNAVLAVPGNTVELAASWWSCDMTCDHCNTKRQRKNSFLVANDAGEIKIVGRNCLADFLGGADPDAVLASAMAMLDIDCLFDQEDWPAVGGYADYVYEIAAFIVAVIACIRVDGWVSKSRASESGLLDTAGEALRLIGPAPRALGAREAHIEFCRARRWTDAEKAEAAAVIEWARAIDPSVGNSYLRNVRAALSAPEVVVKMAGIAASAVVAYRREQGEAKKAEVAGDLAHVGTEGDRVELALKVEAIIPIEGYYGVSYLHKFVDGAGNRLTWFASRRGDLNVGDDVTGKATIKAHDEYKGVPVTKITRAALRA